MSDYFEQIGGQWRDRARELAAWAMTRMVNRTDVWGRYVRKRLADGTRDDLGHPVTAPFRDERGKVFLQESSLEKHFKSQRPTGLLGLHCTSSDLTSRWLAIDIDLHDPDQLSVTAQGNFAAAQAWHKAFVELGFDPLLLDSNGRGGFHLLVLFDQPQGAASVNAFVKRFCGDYLKRGLDQMPEVFPGTPRWDHYGDWLRLPGRHHTYPHYSRVWNDEPWTDQPWLEGHEAIDRLLAARPATAETAAANGIEPVRRTICLDFDGVVHSYRSGWCGSEIIPDPPIHGTREAIARLRQRYRVVIHSSRCSTEAGRRAVEHWLARHEIVVDEVCIHKPPALVYVDDRAVQFRGDWDQALIAINDFRR
jgi:hypothetical protein